MLWLCQAGAKVADICNAGDIAINKELKGIYNKKKYTKGISFPTSVSVNEVVGNFVPLQEEDYSHAKGIYTHLKVGDVVKVDLGVQIQGFSANAAHTVVVTATPGEVTKGPTADVILAAYAGLQAGLRQMYEGKHNNYHVTESVRLAAESYSVNPVEGVLSHRMTRDVVDGQESIINKVSFDQQVDLRPFAFGDVFAVDVVVSTGEGKPRDSGAKSSILKRCIENTYNLKSESARKFLSLAEINYSSFPFSLNGFNNPEKLVMKGKVENVQNVAKVGIVECLKNELFTAYPVLVEKEGDVVAQFKWTIAVRKDKPFVVAGLPLDEKLFASDKEITHEGLKNVLSVSLDTFLPGKKEGTKTKVDSKAKREKRKAAKEKRKEELKKKTKEEQ